MACSFKSVLSGSLYPGSVLLEEQCDYGATGSLNRIFSSCDPEKTATCCVSKATEIRLFNIHLWRLCFKMQFQTWGTFSEHFLLLRLLKRVFIRRKKKATRFVYQIKASCIKPFMSADSDDLKALVSSLNCLSCLNNTTFISASWDSVSLFHWR